MKRISFASVGIAFAVVVGLSCSNDDSTGSPGTAAGTGGSNTGTGTGGSTANGSGGTTGTGGTGNATGTGGSSQGGTNNTTGTGGTNATGTGGVAAGTGGASPVDSSTGQGGATTPDASTGTGGSTGMPETGGPITISGLTGTKNGFNESFMDSFMLFGCFSQAAQDCITFQGACPNQNAALPMEQQGLVSHETFQLGGTPGTMYRVTLTVGGVTEGKYYQNGTRAAGTAAPANADDPNGIDTFYTGGDPVNQENYNIYKITVRNPPAAGADAGTEVQHYYLNSMPQNTGVNFENHNTFPLHYVHDIVVPGGGTIEYLTEDRNCHAVDNCGPGSRSVSCPVTAGRMVPQEPTLVIPSMYMGQQVSALNTLNGTSQPFHSQILHIRVTNVVAM